MKKKTSKSQWTRFFSKFSFYNNALYFFFIAYLIFIFFYKVELALKRN